MKFTEHLTETQIGALRQLYIDGKPIVWLAKEFNVSRVTISNWSKKLLGGKTWRELRKLKNENEREFEEQLIIQKKKEEVEELKSERRDRRLSANEQSRRKWLRKTINEVDGKLRLPKLKPSEYIALSKYRLELENELIGKDEIIIIGAPEEFPDNI